MKPKKVNLEREADKILRESLKKDGDKDFFFSCDDSRLKKIYAKEIQMAIVDPDADDLEYDSCRLPFEDRIGRGELRDNYYQRAYTREEFCNASLSITADDHRYYKIIKLISESGELSVEKFIEMTGIPKSTCYWLINKLENRGVVAKRFIPSRGGRPRSVYYLTIKERRLA